MMNVAKLTLLLAAAAGLSGCVDGLRPYSQSPDTVIATGIDRGPIDKGVLENGGAAIAYDPDGCQNWIIDDGAEGYSSPRYDPATGLPICNNLYPPGTVLREYRRGGVIGNDYTPRPGVNTVVRRSQGYVAY